MKYFERFSSHLKLFIHKSKYYPNLLTMMKLVKNCKIWLFHPNQNMTKLDKNSLKFGYFIQINEIDLKIPSKIEFFFTSI